MNVLQMPTAVMAAVLAVGVMPKLVSMPYDGDIHMMYWNKVYDGAMGWTAELSKFGAHAVMCDPHRVITFGGKPLAPSEVDSPYIIRVAIALLMVAALAAACPGTARAN